MPLAPDYQPHAVVPCFAWVPRPGADLVDGQKVAIRQDVRMMVALGIDLKAGDQVAQITDTRGTVLHRGPLRIEGELAFKHNQQAVGTVRDGCSRAGGTRARRPASGETGKRGV